jgi:hypothetical protein
MFSRVYRWEPVISRLRVFVLGVLVGSDFCASCFPHRGDGGVEVVLVELVWGVEERSVVRLSGAALFSSAWRRAWLSSCLGLGIVFFALSCVL